VDIAKLHGCTESKVVILRESKKRKREKENWARKLELYVVSKL
jgi:hypothetical protein